MLDCLEKWSSFLLKNKWITRSFITVYKNGDSRIQFLSKAAGK